MPQQAPTRKQRREQARAERVAREQESARRAQRKRRLGILGAVAGVAVVAVAIAIVVSSGGSSKPTTSTQTTSLFAGIPQKGSTLGSANAPVTMHEFGDLQCPVCREFALDALPGLVRQYVRTGRVKIVFHSIAIIGQDSIPASEAAQAAGMQNKMWPFIDRFYADQGQENSGYVTQDFISRIASEVPGLDKQKLLSDMASPAAQQAFIKEQKQAKTLGVKATPTFFAGQTGKTQQVLQPTSLTPDGFRAQLDALLSKSS
jgi:protein-disulfide isomerase